jgi:hypothetical protein
MITLKELINKKEKIKSLMEKKSILRAFLNKNKIQTKYKVIFYILSFSFIIPLIIASSYLHGLLSILLILSFTVFLFVDFIVIGDLSSSFIKKLYNLFKSKRTNRNIKYCEYITGTSSKEMEEEVDKYHKDLKKEDLDINITIDEYYNFNYLSSLVIQKFINDNNKEEIIKNKEDILLLIDNLDEVRQQELILLMQKSLKDKRKYKNDLVNNLNDEIEKTEQVTLKRSNKNLIIKNV